MSFHVEEDTLSYGNNECRCWWNSFPYLTVPTFVSEEGYHLQNNRTFLNQGVLAYNRDFYEKVFGTKRRRLELSLLSAVVHIQMQTSTEYKRLFGVFSVFFSFVAPILARFLRFYMLRWHILDWRMFVCQKASPNGTIHGPLQTEKAKMWEKPRQNAPLSKQDKRSARNEARQK